jgi:ABC-type transport system involved in cytochrome c biogenesis permease subunit
MAIKMTFAGALIYAAMFFCATAFAAHLLKSQRAGRSIFAVAFLCILAAFAVRWKEAGHVPMQSLFEVFLCLGIAVFPLSVFWRRYLGASGETLDPLLAFAVLFPAGFVFMARPQYLPPALQCWLFVPHVAAYMLAYIVLVKASLLSPVQWLAGTSPEERLAAEQSTYRLVRFGFPLLTLGLILGAWWARMAWGDYWGWDPKELWSLATWLVFLAYLHLRSAHGQRFGRLQAALVAAGGVCIAITLLWVNLAAKLFPGPHTYAM